MEAVQGRLDFETVPPPAPPAVDPHLVEALSRIHQRQNRIMLARLLRGPIRTDELDRHDRGWGKRAASRLHDIRQWLRALGYQGGDPIPRRSLDAERGLFEWALTDEALRLARRETEAGD